MSNSSSVHSRAMQVLLVAVIGVAVTGFFIGVRHEHRPTFEPPRSMPTPLSDESEVIPAMAYGEFDRRMYGANREWRSDWSTLAKPASTAAGDGWLQPGKQNVLLTRRATRRAFDGAPPTVPHPIEQMTTVECLVCHLEAQYVGKQTFAPAMSHDLMPNCTQCHIEQNATAFEPPRKVENTFQGIVRPSPGSRTWSAAPPTVPHSLVMRDKCLSCHGPAGAHAIRVDHPWDSVCLQCHLPADRWRDRAQFGMPETRRRLGMLESLGTASGDAPQ